MSEVIAKIRSAKGYTMKVRVEFTREYRIRMWLAGLFIRIGIWISGADCDIENVPYPKGGGDEDRTEA